MAGSMGSAATSGRMMPSGTRLSPVVRPKSKDAAEMTSMMPMPEELWNIMTTLSITWSRLLIRFCTKYTPMSMNMVLKLIPLKATGKNSFFSFPMRKNIKRMLSATDRYMGRLKRALNSTTM